MTHHLRTLAVHQLQSLDDTTRLVVIHPNYIQQHFILSEIYDQIGIYVRFEGKDLDYPALSHQFAYALSSENIDLSGKIIVLDECDRAENSAFEEFLSKQLKQTKAHRIFVFCRQFPGEWLQENPIWKNALYLPTNHHAMMWNYADLQTDSPLLEVRSFGEGHATLNGKIIDQWDGILPRSLFFYLIDRGMTTRSEIFETFWPNLSTREATNVFHVTKRKINEVLGVDITTYWSGFYRISPQIQLSYDVIQFSELLQNSAISSLGEASKLLVDAVTLYRSNFLHTLDMPWANARRNELRQDYAEALENLAAANVDADEKQTALGLYLRAAAISGNRSAVITHIIQLYRELNMHAEALDVYKSISMETPYMNYTNGGRDSLESLVETIRQEMG